MCQNSLNKLNILGPDQCNASNFNIFKTPASKRSNSAAVRIKLMKGREVWVKKSKIVPDFKEIKIPGITNFTSVPRKSEKNKQTFCKHTSGNKEKNNTRVSRFS